MHRTQSRLLNFCRDLFKPHTIFLSVTLLGLYILWQESGSFGISDVNNLGFFTKTFVGKSTTIRPMAICLAGGLRAFELTGPSIQKYLLSTYTMADVFVVTHKDKDTWKIHMLNGEQLVAVRIFKQVKIAEGDITREVIHKQAGSPSGIQGILQYFALVEGCNELIDRYEALHNVRYKWVLRTRPDGIWAGPPPPLHSFHIWQFYIPAGSDWWGINDRFGLGNRKHSRDAMKWLSSLPVHRRHGHIQLTSEDAYKRLLQMKGVLKIVDRSIIFPFCIITKRKWSFPPTKIMDGRVVPIGTPSAVNGAYCRPCVPETNEYFLKQIPMEELNLTEICNATSAWQPGWEGIFDHAVGQDLALSRQQYFRHKNYFKCIELLSSTLKYAKIWEGQFSVSELCMLAFPKNSG